MTTVNSLPQEYAGEFTIILNDHNPYVTLRNVIMLLILGDSDATSSSHASDVALYFWYSAFMPGDYYLAIMKYAMAIVRCEGVLTQRLGTQSSVQIDVPPDVQQLCCRTVLSNTQYNEAHAANEMARVQ
jgi:hypothetical protein